MVIISGNHLVAGAHLRHAIWRQAPTPCALSDSSDRSDLSDWSDRSDTYPATSLRATALVMLATALHGLAAKRLNYS